MARQLNYPVRMMWPFEDEPATNGLRMDGNPDSDGDVFVVHDIEDLFNPDTETDTTQRYDMGARLNAWRYKPLEFTIKGTAYSLDNTRKDPIRLREKLTRWSYPQGISRQRAMLIDIPDGYGIPPVEIRAVRTGIHLPYTKHGLQDFEIDFFAPDPRKYAQTETTVHALSGGVWALPNAGTAYTYAQAFLTQPASSFPLLELRESEEDGGGVLAQFGFSSGREVGTYIDFGRKETLTPEGVPVDMEPWPRQWWSIPPRHASRSVRLAVTGGGEWVIAYKQAWI